MAGLWLDHHLPIGGGGTLMFFATVGVIVFTVEATAGLFGDWIDDRIHRQHAAR